MGVTFSLNDEARHWLSRLARQSITTALEGREDGPPPLPPALAGGTLAQSLGSFVTLNKDGDLRGCIGNMVGREPLWRLSSPKKYAKRSRTALQPAVPDVQQRLLLRLRSPV